jgi:hypothetical protein
MMMIHVSESEIKSLGVVGMSDESEENAMTALRIRKTIDESSVKKKVKSLQEILFEKTKQE